MNKASKSCNTEQTHAIKQRTAVVVKGYTMIHYVKSSLNHEPVKSFHGALSLPFCVKIMQPYNAQRSSQVYLVKRLYNTMQTSILIYHFSFKDLLYDEIRRPILHHTISSVSPCCLNLRYSLNAKIGTMCQLILEAKNWQEIWQIPLK